MVNHLRTIGKTSILRATGSNPRKPPMMTGGQVQETANIEPKARAKGSKPSTSMNSKAMKRASGAKKR